MVQNHRVSMIPRTEFSVCEVATIGKRKETLLRSEIFTELEVSQFFCEFLDNRTGAVGVGEAWFRKIRAQLGDRVAQHLCVTAAERRPQCVERGEPMARASFRWCGLQLSWAGESAFCFTAGRASHRECNCCGFCSIVTFVTGLRGRQQVAAVSCGVASFGDLFWEAKKQFSKW